MLIPFFINRNRNFNWGDSFVSGKELTILISAVIGVLLLGIFIILPILEYDKERSLRVAIYHKEDKEFVRYVIEAVSDDFLSPWERIVIKYKYTELESQDRDKRERERINDIKLELVNSLNSDSQ